MDEVTTQLSCTFPDHDIMDAFNVLYPKFSQHMSANEQSTHLNTLCNKFSIQIDECQKEWRLINVIFTEKYSECDLAGVMTRFLNENRESFPNISKLAAIGLSLPVTSVNCERGISAFNAIKTDSRNMISVNHMQNLMLLYLEAKDIHSFNFEKAFETWANAKKRRGFATMVNNEKLK